MFQQPEFRWFQCILGENSDKSFNYPCSYIQSGELNNDTCKNTNETVLFNLFGRNYNESIWDSDINSLILLARKGIMQLEFADTSFKTTDYYEIRRKICELFLAIRVLLTRNDNDYHTLQAQVVPQLKLILHYHITRLKHLPEYVVFNSIEKIENTNNAAYNYLHLCLDMYWLLSITLEYNLEDESTSKLEIFERNLHILISDLIYVAHKVFERRNFCSDLTKLSPYLCSCFKELWFLLQKYVEKLHNQQFCKDFWYYFNNAIKTELNLQSSNKCIEAIEGLWILYNIAQIQGYNNDGLYIGADYYLINSNFSLVEHCLRIITNANSNQIDENLMCSCLYLISFFQLTWWKKDGTFDLLQLLWEYFYKRFNSSFSVNNETGNIINNLPKFINYNELVDNILNLDLNTSTTTTASSYEIYLCLLGKYLIKNPLHWPKLKGRIYSKLPTQKLIAFTDADINNLVQLFLVLAHAVNFTELTDKLQSLLNQLPETKLENSPVIWSAHMSLLLTRVQRKVALNGVTGAEICTPILLAVQSASSDRSRSHLMRIFIDGLKKMIEIDEGLECQEYVLFDNWIGRYLQWCSYSDACYLIDIIKKIVEKVQILGEHQDWWNIMENHVVPSIKQLSSVSDTPQQISELAAILISADLQRFHHLFEHMTGDTINISLSIKFLHSFLEQNSGNLENLKDYEPLLIQAWIRIALINADKSELIELTQAMTNLPQWSTIIGIFDVNSEDALYAVIRLAGYRLKNAKTFLDNLALKRWFETYFGKMDRWISPAIAAAERGDNAQLVLRVYTSASLLFYHCSSALYIKNKNTCLLYRLTTTLLLPSSVLMNKKPSNFILTALRKTWHLFMKGFSRLDFKNDNYIERTMKDMVVRYVPHMYDTSSPILRCMEDNFENNLTAFILEKIAVTFLPCKLKNTHELCGQTLKLILEMSNSRTDFAKIEIFVKIILPYLFELLIFVDDGLIKHNIIQIIQSIKMNAHYSELRETIENSLLQVINKHLSFYSTNVFKFIESIINLLPIEITNIIPKIKDAIHKVESMRGVGYDNTLRKGLQRIHDMIKQQTK